MIKSLTLLRHGKAAPHQGSQSDFDRPLTMRGRLSVEAVGRYLREQGAAFDLILGSGVKRVVETIDALQDGFGPLAPLRCETAIYEASAAALLESLRHVEDANHRLLLVGHNPGLQQLALCLTPQSDPRRREVEQQYPTGGLIVLEAGVQSWRDLAPGCAHIADYITPGAILPAGE